MHIDTISSGKAPAIAVIVLVHGFKGDDTTFLDFPSRLKHNLTSLFAADVTTPRSSMEGNADGGTSSPRPATQVHTLVYPAFATRGELSACVETFVAWLATQVAEIEMEYSMKSASHRKELARVVLIGHSMGGIVVADAARSVARDCQKAEEKERMWPRIVGVLAYDTPYLGVHPGVFKHGATEAWGYVQQAQAVASSVGIGWTALQGINGKSAATPSTNAKGKQRQQDALTQTLTSAGQAAQKSANASSQWGKIGFAAAGATALAAAAGTAWYSRQKIASTAADSQLWVTSHLEFVGVLWKEETLRERLEELLNLSDSHIQFHCFYTLLKQDSRTFIVLPSNVNFPQAFIQAESRFSSNLNEMAKTEVEAHTAMFDLHSNSGVWDLGSQSISLIAAWLRSDGRRYR